MEKALKVCLLGSGSKGNSIYVSDGETAVLFDAGFSGRELHKRMELRGINPETLKGIVVSHEHGDHVKGVGVLSRRYSIPVYITKATSKALKPYIRKLYDVVYFEDGKSFNADSLTVQPFAISHDVADPCGFVVEACGKRLGIITDAGKATALVVQRLKQCDMLVLESNFDPKMLEEGPYPWHLKQRIKSREGHLSNFEAKSLLEEVLHPGLKRVVLAHLSETNNKPEMALEVVGRAVAGCSTALEVAGQDKSTKIFSV